MTNLWWRMLHCGLEKQRRRQLLLRSRVLQ